MFIVAVRPAIFVIEPYLAVGVSVVVINVKDKMAWYWLGLGKNATKKEVPIPEYQKHLQAGDWRLCPSKTRPSEKEGGQGNLMSKVRSRVRSRRQKR